MAKVVLGNEWDERTLALLFDVIMKMNGVIESSLSGVGGSQDVRLYNVKLREKLLFVEVETYMGISIIGDDELINEIVNKIKAA